MIIAELIYTISDIVMAVFYGAALVISILVIGYNWIKDQFKNHDRKPRW